jgi:hypothetical protein
LVVGICSLNIPSLTIQHRFANICHAPEWWNWQTRRTQNPVSLADMGVQAPPSAPTIYKGIFKGYITMACLFERNHLGLRKE